MLSTVQKSMWNSCVSPYLKNAKKICNFMAEKYDKSSVGRLEIVRSTPFKRVTYTEAVDLVVEAVKDGKKFENHVEWGIDLEYEHERYVVYAVVQYH